LVRDQVTKEKAPQLRDRVVDMAFDRGLLVLGAGDNTIRLCPPLVISKAEIDRMVTIVDESLTAAEREFGFA